MSDQKSRAACRDFTRLRRRDILEAGALGVCGLSLGSMFAGQSHAAAATASAGKPAGFGRAKRCILLFMWGGPSHLDTWDLKPNAPVEVRGEFKPISTNVPDIQISEHFPRLAKHADKYAIIRSMTHDDPAHLSSVHSLMTGRLAPRPKSDAEPPSRRDWPQIGTFLGRLKPTESALPSSVTLPWIVSHPAAPGGIAPGQHGGMLGAAHDPFVIDGDPNAAGFQVGGLALPGDLTRERLDARRSLLKMIDGQQAKLQPSDSDAFSKHQQRAIDLLAARDTRGAFDLSRESPQTRERYGRNIHGQSVLMARRLAEAGVPLVCVNWHNDGQNFWDTHGNNFARHKNDLMPPSDMAFSELLEDLSQRGMLDETLVVWVGEFGRRPHITAGNAGREHWPWCYSAVVAGGGVRGGQVFGRSDPQGLRPAGDPVSPGDLCATMYHALGISPEMMVNDREGRPVRLTEGDAVKGLFAS